MPFDKSPERSHEIRSLAFLKRGGALRGLSDIQLQRIEQRLGQAGGWSSRARWRPWAMAVATSLVVLLASATVAVARGGLSRVPLIGAWLSTALESPPRERADSRESHGLRGPPRNHAAALRLPESPVVESPVVESPVAPAAAPPLAVPRAPATPLPASSVVPPSSPKNARGDRLPARAAPLLALGRFAAIPAPSVPGAPAVPSVEAPVVVESRSFSEALAKWHRTHDAQATLLALAAHERAFPQGQMELEARLLRAEVLLHERQEGDALVALESVALAGLPRRRELQTVRGELRVKLGHCEDGRSDLRDVLSTDDADAFAERAKRALRLCR